MPYILAIVIGLAALHFTSQLTSFYRNYSRAKASGLPCKVIPQGILTPALFLPFVNILPKAWLESWLPLVVIPRAWHAGYKPFEEAGADTFIAVSPSHNALWTCDPETILQISKSKDEYPKAVKAMSVLNVYGPTVTATDGEESRLYRRIVAPSFNEATYEKLWTNTTSLIEELVSAWTRSESSATVQRLGKDAASMTLHIMSRVCFGREMEWTADLSINDHSTHKGARATRYKGLTYSQALSEMLEGILIIFLLPARFLRISPIKSHRHAWTSFCAWRSYMADIQASAEVQLRHDPDAVDKPNLLQSLVLAASLPKPSINQEAIMGNIFIFLLAGHETTASTLQFAILCLACNPSRQRHLQRSIDGLLNQSAPSSWSFHKDFHKLYCHYPGAVIRETVRLFTVLPFYMRTTMAHPQSLCVGGETYNIPPETLILVNTSAAHRHPQYWPRPKPTEAPAEEEMPYALSEWDPERWIDPATGEVNEGRAIKASGTFVPFSKGTRECMGRRFAEVELTAMLVRLFSEWTIELDVAGLTGSSEKDLFVKARSRASKMLSRGIGFGVALKMLGEVPIRIVKRGHERFDME